MAPTASPPRTSSSTPETCCAGTRSAWSASRTRCRISSKPRLRRGLPALPRPRPSRAGGRRLPQPRPRPRRRGRPARRAAPPPAPAPGPAPARPSRAAPRLVTEPVRSGTQIYARGTDLVVTAAVSPGAELVADGNIHVYGALRGRAMAGASGDVEARIFCSRLEAELVSIAGRYLVSEQLPAEQRGFPVQIVLVDDQLTITRN